MVRGGVEQLYEAFKVHGPTLEDLTGSRFQRIAHVRSLLEQDRLDADLRGLGGRSGVLQSL